MSPLRWLVTEQEEHRLRRQTELALALGHFLTSSMTLASLGVLSLGFLICNVGKNIPALQGWSEEAACLWHLAHG